MRSPGDSGGLRISPVFREGELVHRREVIFWVDGPVSESECVEWPVVLSHFYFNCASILYDVACWVSHAAFYQTFAVIP